MPERRTYRNPPIVEAITEVHFAVERSPQPADMDALRAVLRGDYPGEPRTTNQLQLEASVDSGGGLATSARTSLRKVLVPSADEKSFVGIGPRDVSMHVLAPYPGWERFLERTKVAVAAFREVLRPPAISAVAVRYIDQIALPDDVNDLAEYFPRGGVPQPPEAMPGRIMGFHVVTQVCDEPPTVQAFLTFASAPPTQDGRPVVLYDLKLIETFAEPLSLEAWVAPLSALHERQRDVFEGSITEKTRGLFQ